MAEAHTAPAGLTDGVAAWITGTRFQDISATATHLAKTGILDCVGVTLAGQPTAPAALARELAVDLGGHPRCTVLGTDLRTNSLLAALANGTSAHALDYDDANHPLFGHPSCHLVPALLALGEEWGASGRALLAAYTVGFEVEVRMARAVQTEKNLGWHPTVTLGTLGAAAAGSHLLGLTPEQTRHALGIACSLASGVRENVGSMTKPLHAGLAAKNGVLATLLARRGFTAAPDAMGGRYGFVPVFGGERLARPEELDPARFGAPWEVTQPVGLAIKQFPCCAATHPAIEAAISLAVRHNLNPDAVEAVAVGGSVLTPRILRTDPPRTGLEGKFSMEYCVATALVRREVRLGHFEDAALGDPAVQALMGRVRYQVVAHLRDDPEFPAVVTIHLRDGSSVTEEVLLAKGKTARPLERAELVAKYRDCAGRALSPAAVAESLTRLEHLEDVAAVGDLTRWLAVGQEQGQPCQE